MPKETKPSERITVRAISTGTYPDPGCVRAFIREPGAIFSIEKREHFSSSWMEEIDLAKEVLPLPKNPERPQTTAPSNSSGMNYTAN